MYIEYGFFVGVLIYDRITIASSTLILIKIARHNFYGNAEIYLTGLGLGKRVGTG